MRTQTQYFTYQGSDVEVPVHADMPQSFRPDGTLGDVVQTVLNNLEPWDDPIGVIESYRLGNFKRKLHLRVVPTEDREVFWGVHKGHKARAPQPSPFVKLLRPQATSWVTIELVGLPDAARLTRVYTGDEYIPPLPWQKSHKDAPGGYQECLEFWMHHAFEYQPTFVRGELSTFPPDWYLNALN